MNSSRAFERVFKSKRRHVDGAFVVLTRPNGERQARLGMVVSKRNAPRAVARNRIKRVIRESFRCHQALLGGLDVVVMARADTVEHDNHDLRESLIQHWRWAAAQKSWKASE